MNKEYLNEDLSELFEDIEESSNNEELDELFEDVIDEEILPDDGLMKLLEENGFEASEENLTVLKENKVLNEGKFKKFLKTLGRTALTVGGTLAAGVAGGVAGKAIGTAAGLASAAKIGKVAGLAAGTVGSAALNRKAEDNESDEGEKIIRESSRTERFVKAYLIEDCHLTEAYVETLLEDEKSQNVSAVIMELFNNIKDKLSNVDTISADRSRGDIKSLRELPYIQDAITKLEKMLEINSDYFPELANYIETIVKSVLYLNQYSNDFKDAYRNKKTLIILKYQSLILSIISSLSYLISVSINFKTAEPSLKNDIVIEEIAPLKTLKQFVDSVASGEFKMIVKDVTVMREYYCEIPVETMTQLLEAGDTLNMVINGVKNMASQLTGGKVANLIYKLSGVVVLLFSLRDIFYTLFRAKTKITDMITNIQAFANETLGAQFSKLITFNNKMRADLESATDLAKRDLEDENRNIAVTIKSNSLLNKPVEVQPVKPVDDNNGGAGAGGDSFFFDF